MIPKHSRHAAAVVRLLTGAFPAESQYRQALPLNEQALAGLRQLLGEDHPDTLWSVHSLAEALRNLGDLYEQALAGRRRVLGDDHPDTLQSMNNLAAVRQELGEL